MSGNVTKLFKPEAGTVHWLNQCIQRGQAEVFSEATTVTPGLASIILAKNDHNRNIRPAKLAQFAADMRKGRWAFNGEPIILAKTGELNDGQHRLSALVDANVTIPLVIVFGVERDTRTTVDQGAARKASDYLHMEGEKNAATLAGLVRLSIAYERSGYDSIMNSNLVTNAEVLARARSDELAKEAAEFAQGTARVASAFASPSVIGFCYYTFAVESSVEAKDYMTQVCGGEGLKRSDPAYAVRERLLSLGQRNREMRTEIIFRGWNAYRRGGTLTIAKVLGNLPVLV
jgi:hypothetical protein